MVVAFFIWFILNTAVIVCFEIITVASRGPPETNLVLWGYGLRIC